MAITCTTLELKKKKKKINSETTRRNNSWLLKRFFTKMRVTGPGQKRRRRRREERGEEKRLVYGNMAGRWEFDGRMSHYRALWPPPPALLSPSFDTVRVPASVPSAIQREANALNENGWCTFNIVNWSGVRGGGEEGRGKSNASLTVIPRRKAWRDAVCFVLFVFSLPFSPPADLVLNLLSFLFLSLSFHFLSVFILCV